MKAGTLFRDSGRTAEAGAVFRESAEDEPDRPQAFHELGDLLLDAGDFSGAVEPLRAAADLSQDSAGVRTSLGAALLGADRPEAAAEAFRETVALDPEDPSALGALAGILAAHPRRDLRDPAEVALTERLAGRFSFGEARSLDLLAAAGDFRGAVEGGGAPPRSRGERTAAQTLSACACRATTLAGGAPPGPCASGSRFGRPRR